MIPAFLVAVLLSICNTGGSLQILYRVCLPEEWANDAERHEKVGVPGGLALKPKPDLAMEQTEATLKAGHAPSVLLGDVAYNVRRRSVNVGWN